MAEPKHTAVLAVPARLIAFGRHLGVDPGELHAASGLSPADLADLDGRADYASVYAIWRLLKARFGERPLGLELPQTISTLDHFGVVGALIQNSPTVRECLERFQRYARLIDSAVDYVLRVDGARAGLCVIADAPMRELADPVEGILANLVLTARRLSQGHFTPSEIWFEHERRHPAEPYAAFFRAPVRFGQPETVLFFPAAVLGWPIPSADAQAGRYLELLAGRLLAEAPERPEASFAESVRTAIRSGLAAGEASEAGVAKRLATSVRTLQRRLRESETSYAALLEQVRRQLAADLVAAGHYSLTEVAFILGYSEPSSFHRAFKRWTGTTPEQFRRQGLAEGRG
jgi:AraC-like DNA-binding protein